MTAAVCPSYASVATVNLSLQKSCMLISRIAHGVRNHGRCYQLAVSENPHPPLPWSGMHRHNYGCTVDCSLSIVPEINMSHDVAYKER